MLYYYILFIGIVISIPAGFDTIEIPNSNSRLLSKAQNIATRKDGQYQNSTFYTEYEDNNALTSESNFNKPTIKSNAELEKITFQTSRTDSGGKNKFLV